MNRPMLLLALALIVITPCRAESPGLRYRFTPGQHMVYERTGEGAGYTVRGQTSLWVLGVTEAGGFDLLLYEANRNVRPGEQPGEPDQVAMIRFTLAPDGSITHSDRWDEQIDPRNLLPLLPGADPAGWEDENPERQTTSRYTLRQDGSAAPGTTRIEARIHTTTDVIYGVSREQLFTFDQSRGLVTRIENKLNYDKGGVVIERLGRIELLTVEELEAEAFTAFKGDAVRYLEAKRACSDAAHLTERSGTDKGRALMRDARDRLIAAKQGVSSAIIAGLFDNLEHTHDHTSEYLDGNTQLRAMVVGKPAADWTLKDLAGNQHALKDYRGRVVILDYWYRGCYWCVMGMPQINRVADHFRDRPVAVLGMNTDRSLDDALFVQDKMGLRYPSLRAADTPRLYQVQSFPTLIVIDPAGVVRGYHVGYSPTMYEDLVAEVQALLAEAPR